MPEKTLPPPSSQRYEIRGHRHQGKTAHIYRAWDTRDNRWVALKRLPPPSDQTPFPEEVVEKSIALIHPNLIRIYGMEQDAAGTFLVMEWLEGMTLEETVQPGVLSLEEFVDIARQSLAGMIAFHQAGLLHHDLKPDNIMRIPRIDAGPQVKVLDFGLSQLFSSLNRSSRHGRNEWLGSVYTMAPEQFNQETLDARTDLYALGCVFYYVVVGTYPFTGKTTMDVMIAHLQHRVIPLKTLRTDFPDPLCGWVMHLLEKDAVQRPLTAEHALQRLNQLWMAPE